MGHRIAPFAVASVAADAAHLDVDAGQLGKVRQDHLADGCEIFREAVLALGGSVGLPLGLPAFDVGQGVGFDEEAAHAGVSDFFDDGLG